MSVSDEFTESFEQYWSSDTVTSLRQIQALYGAIEEASRGGESVVPEECQLYVTPGELDGFTTEADEDNCLVTVLVDLTGKTPELDGVDVSPLRPDMVDRLGFSRFPWGRGIDHSITRRGAKGGSTRETVATYCQDCLERWTDADEREPAIGEVAEEHSDGWVIRDLQTIGLQDDLAETLETELWPLLGAEEKPRVVATVAIAVNPDELEQPPTGTAEDGYYYPGQLPVLNEGMRARKDAKLATKNSDIPSRSDGTCLVTGANTEVFGTAEDPLAFFTVQHAEKFSELKKEHAWRAHPVSSAAALLIQSGASLVEQCRRTRRGRSVYTIPYFTRIDADRAALLRYAIEDIPGDVEVSIPRIQSALEKECDEDALAAIRYYVIALRNDSGDINVLHEVPDATVMPVRRVAEAHRAVLDGAAFNAVAGFDTPENWQPITDGTDVDDVVRSITSGLYAFGTLAQSDEDDPSTDDTSEWLTFSLLTGDPVPVQRLLGEYVERLAQERADDAEGRLSANHLKAQYAQLEALARAGRLLTTNHPELSNPPRMTDAIDDSDVPPAEQFLTDDGKLPVGPIREYRLERFLDDRPAFTDDSRRAAFLAGVLIGQLGSYQSDPKKRDMNRTVLQQYPAEQMSGERITRFVPELIHKSNVYAADDEYSGPSLFPELDDRLPAALSDAAAAEWSIPVEDLRFHYALGQLYGKRALSRAFDLRSEIARIAGIDLEQKPSVTNSQ